MTRERGQEEAAGDEAHVCRAAWAGVPAGDLRACGEAHDGPDSIGAITARAPRACRVARPAPSPRRRGRVTVVGTGPGGSAGVVAAQCGDDGAVRPVVGAGLGGSAGVVAAQCGDDGAVRPVVGAGLGGSAGVAAARRGDGTPLRHTVGDKRWATLRRVVASQTETAGPAPLSAHGRRAEEGAR
ncbi:DUF6380 family protein [Streptomyces violaceus]|uniref:Uncharacterized protein n=1 Tax=Streptomyces violaceus TaxID=1936 RepID=A0ABY9U3I4_STRVL|nr:DUF6380 family protein [Streptomyces janthinus]WND16894.1 hypothetical protein RI060_05760 [Streptomyces janthinus]GGS42216.1 hypothetical protein GCM10010270_10260 [Streptomyces janthinus]